jgi:hypothetical protein
MSRDVLRAEPTRAQRHDPLQVPQLGGELAMQSALAFFRNN